VIRRILATGIIAGLLAGTVAFALQAVTVTPLIEEAEKYEAASSGQTPGMAKAAAEAGGGGAGRFARSSLSLLAALLTGAGFGLVLAGAIALSGREPDLKEGILWGLAGYGVFVLAPALVLPPHLPGMAEGDLMARQGLWLATAAATAAGLALLAFSGKAITRGLGLVPLALPFILAKPHPAGADGTSLPADLVAAFVAASLVSSVLFWVVLGASASVLLGRFFGPPKAS
jgi:cobalt transporter subunit CbtA